LEQGGCTEKPVAAIPKSIGSHDTLPLQDFTFSKSLLTRFNAQGNSIALSGFEDNLPCPQGNVTVYSTAS